MSRAVALVILDGRGVSEHPERSAIQSANTPYIDSLYNQVPHTQLKASEESVGLPSGQVGNSEVGHMTLGTGRVRYQDLVKIGKAVTDGTLAQHPILREAIQKAVDNHKTIHLIGLASDG